MAREQFTADPQGKGVQQVGQQPPTGSGGQLNSFFFFGRGQKEGTPRPDFSVKPQIPLFENYLKKQLNTPLVKILLLQTFIRNLISSFKNLEGKSKSQRLLGIGKRTPWREWPISVLSLSQISLVSCNQRNVHVLSNRH